AGPTTGEGLEGCDPMSDEIKQPLLWTGDFYNQGIGRDDIFDKLREECGVFGVFNIPDASNLAYYGLHALQHRGEESAGICTVDTKNGNAFNYHRNMGLVKEVFDKDKLEMLTGDRAIGHVRYSTS